MIGTVKAAVTEMTAFYTTAGKTKRVWVDKRDFYSLSYRFYGEISVRAGDEELISREDSITFVPSCVPYETEIIRDTRMAVVHFKLSADVDFRNPSVITASDGEIRQLFERLAERYRVDDPMNFECMSLFYKLLASLETMGALNGKTQPSRSIRDARERMLREYSSSLFSVSRLAEGLGVSDSYLRREFSRAYGSSPISFLRDLRIARAKTLLKSEYLSVEQIAEQCGFSSASYFIQVFHKVTGISPDKYRRTLIL